MCALLCWHVVLLGVVQVVHGLHEEHTLLGEGFGSLGRGGSRHEHHLPLRLARSPTAARVPHRETNVAQEGDIFFGQQRQLQTDEHCHSWPSYWTNHEGITCDDAVRWGYCELVEDENAATDTTSYHGVNITSACCGCGGGSSEVYKSCATPTGTSWDEAPADCFAAGRAPLADFLMRVERDLGSLLEPGIDDCCQPAHCHSSPSNWLAIDGSDCAQIAAWNACTESYYFNEVSPLEACCECGGGSTTPVASCANPTGTLEGERDRVQCQTEELAPFVFRKERPCTPESATWQSVSTVVPDLETYLAWKATDPTAIQWMKWFRVGSEDNGSEDNGSACMECCESQGLECAGAEAPSNFPVYLALNIRRGHQFYPLGDIDGTVRSWMAFRYPEMSFADWRIGTSEGDMRGRALFIDRGLCANQTTWDCRRLRSENEYEVTGYSTIEITTESGRCGEAECCVPLHCHNSQSDWTSVEGRSCADIERESFRCESEWSDDNIPATDVCCGCGGGSTELVTSCATPTGSTWHEPSIDCEAAGLERIPSWGSDEWTVERDCPPTGCTVDQCCETSCHTSPSNWISADGDECVNIGEWDACDWSVSADGSISALDACCECGGGSHEPINSCKEAAIDCGEREPLADYFFERECDGECDVEQCCSPPFCHSSPTDWRVEFSWGILTCADAVEWNMCNRFDSINVAGISAVEACCGCGGGSTEPYASCATPTGVSWDEDPVDCCASGRGRLAADAERECESGRCDVDECCQPARCHPSPVHWVAQGNLQPCESIARLGDCFRRDEWGVSAEGVPATEACCECGGGSTLPFTSCETPSGSSWDETPVDCESAGLQPLAETMFRMERECPSGRCGVEECCISTECHNSPVDWVAGDMRFMRDCANVVDWGDCLRTDSHGVSAHGVPATVACCGCGGGADAPVATCTTPGGNTNDVPLSCESVGAFPLSSYSIITCAGSCSFDDCCSQPGCHAEPITWRSAHGWSCSTLSRSGFCDSPTYGISADDVLAVDACCGCGGGSETPLPTCRTPTGAGARDTPIDCHEAGRVRLASFDDTPCPDDGCTLDTCCVSAQCHDSPTEWISQYPYMYDCFAIVLLGACDDDRSISEEGVPAADACCGCGGGSTLPYPSCTTPTGVSWDESAIDCGSIGMVPRTVDMSSALRGGDHVQILANYSMVKESFCPHSLAHPRDRPPRWTDGYSNMLGRVYIVVSADEDIVRVWNADDPGHEWGASFPSVAVHRVDGGLALPGEISCSSGVCTVEDCCAPSACDSGSHECGANSYCQYDPIMSSYACPCLAGYARVHGSDDSDLTAAAQECDQCPVGTYSPAGASGCISCVAGRYDHDFNEDGPATPCALCPAGQVQSNTMETACVSCDVGQYQPDEGATDCRNCPGGTWLDTTGAFDESSCIECAAGKFYNMDWSGIPGQAAIASCTGSDNCDAVYSLERPWPCTDSPECAYTPGCVDCPFGRYVTTTGSNELADCRDCPAGTWNDQLGADRVEDCISCAAGKYQAQTGMAAESNCIDCGAGKYGLTEGSWTETDCINCVAGKFSGQLGINAESMCIECAAGKFSETLGSTGPMACIACDAGTYVDSQGNNAPADCIPCGAGKFSTTVGATTESVCIDCVAGRWSSSTGNDDDGQCLTCDAGKFSDTVGAQSESTCRDCAAGKFVEVAGSDDAGDCIECGRGKYMYLDTIGSDSQDDCKDLKFGSCTAIEAEAYVLDPRSHGQPDAVMSATKAAAIALSPPECAACAANYEPAGGFDACTVSSSESCAHDDYGLFQNCVADDEDLLARSEFVAWARVVAHTALRGCLAWSTRDRCQDGLPTGFHLSDQFPNACQWDATQPEGRRCTLKNAAIQVLERVGECNAQNQVGENKLDQDICEHVAPWCEYKQMPRGDRCRANHGFITDIMSATARAPSDLSEPWSLPETLTPTTPTVAPTAGSSALALGYSFATVGICTVAILSWQ